VRLRDHEVGSGIEVAKRGREVPGTSDLDPVPAAPPAERHVEVIPRTLDPEIGPLLEGHAGDDFRLVEVTARRDLAIGCAVHSAQGDGIADFGKIDADRCFARAVFGAAEHVDLEREGRSGLTEHPHARKADVGDLDPLRRAHPGIEIVARRDIGDEDPSRAVDRPRHASGRVQLQLVESRGGALEIARLARVGRVGERVGEPAVHAPHVRGLQPKRTATASVAAEGIPRIEDDDLDLDERDRQAGVLDSGRHPVSPGVGGCARDAPFGPKTKAGGDIVGAGGDPPGERRLAARCGERGVVGLADRSRRQRAVELEREGAKALDRVARACAQAQGNRGEGAVPRDHAALHGTSATSRGRRRVAPRDRGSDGGAGARAGRPEARRVPSSRGPARAPPRAGNRGRGVRGPGEDGRRRRPPGDTAAGPTARAAHPARTQDGSADGTKPIAA